MTFRRALVPVDQRRCLDPLVIGLTMIGLLAGCANTDRPSNTEWASRWEQKQELVPAQDELIDGGRSFCDQLLAELRMQLDDLQPTPSESIDPALDSWSAHLRTLAFECPTDPVRISADLATINALAAEIQTALGEY
jgi:hypothetical protein